MTPALDSFESALLTRLRDHVDQQRTAAPRSSRIRLMVAGVATVAAAAAMVVVVPGLGSTAAYSVQEGNSGTITVEVHRLEDAEGLEDALATHGVVADVTYLAARQECSPGRYVPVDRVLAGLAVSMGSELLRVTLPPGTVRDGETFVLAVSGGGGGTSGAEFAGWTDADVTAGPVQPCAAVPGGAG